MTDVYKVGVSLVMTGNFAQVLGVLSQKLLGVNAQVKELEKSFGKLGTAVTGALAAFAGTEVLKTMKTMVEYGDKLVHQQNLMAAAGMNQKEVAEATQKAYEVSARVQTTNLAEAARHIRELRYAFGGTDQATAEVGYVERANAVMKAVGGHDYSDQVWDIVKSLEMTNKTLDPKEFESYVDTMTRLYTASGGKITPQQIFQSFKYGRSAALGWDQEFIGGALGRAIQSMGGGAGGGGGRAGPGNALMSAYQAIVGDRMTKSAAHEFGGLGLLNGKGVSGDDLFMRNPYEWVQQILMPALAQKGITSPEAVRKEIERLFQNRTASQIMSEFATQGRYMGGPNSMYEKDIRLQGGAKGVGFFDALMNKDYQTNMTAFTEQWNSLMQALGASMVPDAINVLKLFTNEFTKLTKIAGDNPERIRQVSEVIAALAAAFVVLGGAAVIGALAPLVGAGGLIAALAASLIVLGKVDFGGITTKLDNFEKSIQSLGQKLQDWFKNANPGIMGPGFGGTSYTGPGVYGNTSPIMYSGGGGGGGNVSGAAPAATGGISTGSGAASNAGGVASPMSGAIPSGSVISNSYIAAERAGFGKELQDPMLRSQFAAMLQYEGPTLGTAESIMNRAAASGHNLRYMLTGPLGRAFYSTYGKFIHGSPSALRKYNALINQALGGSDTIKGFTDQGMPTDPNGPLNPRHPYHGPYIRQGGNIFNDWQRGRYAGWRLHHEAGAQAAGNVATNAATAHNDSFMRAYNEWQWRNHKFTHPDGGSAGVPDHSAGHEVHVHNSMHIDGRRIAENTSRHLVNSSSFQGGGRFSDQALTRPSPV